MKTSEKILNYIKNNRGVKLVDIKEAIGINSRAVTKYHLDKLLEKGFIKRDGNLYESFSDIPNQFIELPYHGEARCGNNASFSTSEEALSQVPYPINLVKSKLEKSFLMKAIGDSMYPTISDGEYVLFEFIKPNDIKENQVLLCRVNGELKIKRVKLMPDYGLLISDNDEKFDPIKFFGYDDFEVIGKAVNIK